MGRDPTPPADTRRSCRRRPGRHRARDISEDTIRYARSLRIGTDGDSTVTLRLLAKATTFLRRVGASRPEGRVVRLRLLDEMELAGDPARCVELTLPEYRNSTVVAWRLRLTPADVIRLRMETDLLMGEIRAEVLGAVIAWERQLGHWYEEGRVAVEAQEPDVALLRRVLDGLRSTL